MDSAPVLLAFYRTLAPAVRAALPLAAPFSKKLRAGLAGRHRLRQRLAAAAPKLQGCIWVHVTSVGEYEQARPVIQAIQDRRDITTLPIAVTHFSPSGYEFARKHPCADFHDYLPFDTPGAMRELVALWRPRLLIFIKFDCWPNQVLAATEQDVPVVLLAGTLQPRSVRLSAVARPFYRNLFDRFTRLGVCTPEDHDRFTRQLQVRSPVTVTGDTRAEQVILRFEASAAGAVASRLQEWGERIFVLGSTWPQDEALWLPVLPRLLDRFADLRVVLVPHEPLPERLASLQRELAQRRIDTILLSTLMNSASADLHRSRCVLADSVGVLADVYRAGAVAYVGGSFTTGVHNTMEPAIASIPVLFGPIIQNAQEAEVLVARGAGFVVERSLEAAEVLSTLLADPTRLSQCGRAARGVVLDQRGATEKSLALIEPYL